ncbi:Succinyl-CoA synthetase, alpha subunit [Marinitoga hydrogenitolerans DSM 16785]|uniref:Succinyl-CoA synthetase, alpha subunit n=1 Tax=Marinitoga hydrogenitolerans (strain DSM 16785 / JCM 12826 / AT1271) TaxID=1122195 RepID=A0A1M4SAI4_MARH1|nr:acyl-CoA synthetase FdrA [Marinitoga hydrogenitolerans]SHE29067.1 Succinyl-CoA synthetase, alpha subunit [Marinitoga hydrogenitolerans DSM 16785]
MVYKMIKPNAYYDSVTLMLITEDIKERENIEEALVGMGTETNKEFLRELGMIDEELEKTSPNDLLIVIKGENINMDEIEKEIEKMLKAETEEEEGERFYPSLESAVKKLDGANMAVISIAGEYAGLETRKALDFGLNVMLFSDNVPIETEIELKKYALEKGLLVMGPDCGTAIINGVPMAFSNVVKKGKIGMVAASGTGAQEVSSIISNLGCGISQLIGTGGRDVKKDVGGLMFLEGIKRLIDDDETEIIVLVSKPPYPEVVEKAVDLLKKTNKKHVVHFVNGKVEDPSIVVGTTLEDTAIKAALLCQGKEIEKNEYTYFDFLESFDFDKKVKEESEKITEGKYIRGLYSGGTLADETMVLLAKELNVPIYSPKPLKPEFLLENINESKENTIVDMGEDEFTVGRPHPMIDFTMRKSRLIKEYLDKDTAIIMIDVVLGWGSHMDPAGEIAEAVKTARETSDKYKCIIANICGTYEDPQNYYDQKKKLEDVGVIVFPSNASAVKFAVNVWKELGR